MSRILLGIFAVGLLFAVAQALQCYKCDLGIFSLCITRKTTCGSGEKCYSGIGTAAKVFDIKSKGCLNITLCNRTEEFSFGDNKTLYSMNKTCCDGDLCNAALKQARFTPLSFTVAVLTGGMATAALV